jgi:radical SAM protein with 4Fe4S-binding SPASM domain
VQRHLPPSLTSATADSLGFFRWGSVAGKVLLTTDAGDWAFFSQAEFDDLLAGRVVAGHPRFDESQQKGFVRDGLDVDALVNRVAQRNRHVHRGPYLHVLTLTGAAGAMDVATAERIADLALQSTSPALVFELQGHDGEPLQNLEVVRHFVAHAQKRNQRSAGKALSFRLLSNLSAMTEEIAEWLLANAVLVSTSLDGPAEVHDANRQRLGGSAHADVVQWIAYFQRRAHEQNRNTQFPIDALVRVTKHSLAAGRAIVDAYVTSGLRSIDLRPLDQGRVDAETWDALGVNADEYLGFARGVRDEVIARRRGGVELSERQAAVVAQKIASDQDPGVVDLQSPCGAGTGQIVYDADGQLFPCDEARGLAVGDTPLFALGEVGALTLAEVVRHPTVRALAAASLLDTLPQCADCWNKPFCGVNPVRTYIAQGDLIGQPARGVECREQLATATRLFELLAPEAGADAAAVVSEWGAERSPFTTDGRLSKAAP